MAIVAAMTCYDEGRKKWFYLLGSRSSRRNDLLTRIEAEHYRGVLQCSASAEELLREYSIGNCFLDIADGADYSHIPLLKDMPSYQILIAKADYKALELYSLRRLNESCKPVCQILHALYPATSQYDHSNIWFYPDIDYFVHVELQNRFSNFNGNNVMNNLLRKKVSSTPKLPIVHLYIVSFPIKKYASPLIPISMNEDDHMENSVKINFNPCKLPLRNQLQADLSGTRPY